MRKIVMFVVFLIIVLFVLNIGDDNSSSSGRNINPDDIKHLVVENPVPKVPHSCLAVTRPGPTDYWGEDFIIDQTNDVLRDSGVDIAHVYSDWGYIEQSKGVYNWEYADSLIKGVTSRGMRVSLVLTTINPGSVGVFPEDIDFTSFDDEELISRFEVFIEVLLERYGEDISYLWIGNEVDAFLDKNRSQIGEYQKFYDAGFKVVKSSQPDIKVGVISTYHDSVRNNSLDIIKGFSNMDIVGLTLYPQLLEMTPDRIGDLLNDIEALSIEMQIPAAVVETSWSREGYGGSEENNLAYTVDIIERSRDLPDNIKYICLVGPYDLPESIVGFLGGTKSPKEFQRWLLTLSFASSMGVPYDSWYAFIETMRKYSGSQQDSGNSPAP